MNDSTPEATDDVRWYCRRRGQMGSQIVGPLTTAELVKLIDRRSLGERDLIRLGSDGDWQPLSEIRAALMGEDIPASIAPTPPQPTESTGEPEGDRSEAASRAAADVLSEARRRMFRPGHGGTGNSSGRSIVLRRSVLATLVAVIEWTVEGLAWLLGKLITPLRWRSVQFLAVPLLVGVFLVYVAHPRMSIAPAKTYAQYKALLEQIQAFDERDDVTTDEWSQLAAEVDGVVARTQEPLTRQSDHTRPDLQELLSTSRQLPLAVLESQGDKASPALAKAVLHMKTADKWITRRAELMADNRLATPEPLQTDLYFWLAGAVDLALVLWVLRGVLTGRWGGRRNRAYG